MADFNLGKTKFFIGNHSNISGLEKAGVAMLLPDKVNLKSGNITAKDIFYNYTITLKICVIYS